MSVSGQLDEIRKQKSAANCCIKLSVRAWTKTDQENARKRLILYVVRWIFHRVWFVCGVTFEKVRHDYISVCSNGDKLSAQFSVSFNLGPFWPVWQEIKIQNDKEDRTVVLCFYPNSR